MEVNLDISNGFNIVNIAGEVLDYDDLLKLQDRINDAIKRDCSIAVNVSEADYVNSGLIGLFVHWQKLLEARGKRFCIIEPSERTRSILERVGIDKIVKIYPSMIEFMAREK